MTQFGDYIQPKKRRVDRNDQNELTSYLRGNQPQPRQNENNPRDYDQVKVENGSGYSANPFGVLRIHDATWPERTDKKFVNEGMRNGVESLGVKPSTEWDMVSVLQKSAPDRKFAQGVCSGPTPVFVLFRTQESLDYPFAIPIAEDSSELVASPYGLNRILWHSEPSDSFEECTGEVLQAYVNMGEDGQWTFWKLTEDLPCCGSAVGQLCDECGTVLQPDCPIERTIYAPKGLNLCGCEDSCGTWKKDDIVPAWWYQYLEKWVTIPNFHANLEEKEMEVVTGLQITGGTITPSTNFVPVVTNVAIDTNLISLGIPTESPVHCLSGDITLTGAKAEDDITLSGTLGSQENPIQLDVVSASRGVIISGASISSESTVSLTGELSGSASVEVPLSGVSLNVTGTCEGVARGNVYVNGTANVAGNCLINDNFPTLEVDGTVTVEGEATLQGHVEVGQNAISLSGGTQKTFLSSAVLNTTPHTLNLMPTTGRISGTLSSSHTTPVTFSNLTVTLDLSSIFEEVEAVDGDPSKTYFSGCTWHYEKIKVLALKANASLASVTASLSGQINIPSDVVCDYDFSSSASSVTINGVNIAAGTNGLTTTTDSVTVPTTATLDGSKLTVSGTGTMSTEGTVEGTATFPEDAELVGTCQASGTCSAHGAAALGVSGTIRGTATGATGATATGTATITDTVTVSGPLDISSGVEIHGLLDHEAPQYALLNGVPVSLSGSVSIDVTGTISDTRQCYVDVPTSLLCEEGWIDVDMDRIALPSVDLTGATISGITETITYLACADCPEPEEEEEEEEPSA